LTYTRVVAVPRSMARSFEKRPKTKSKIIIRLLSSFSPQKKVLFPRKEKKALAFLGKI
jgi:hypothetical protein